MGDTMTPEQLAAIAARNAARTPGKWTQHLVDDTTVVCRGQDICCTFPGGGLDDDVDFNTDTEQRELDAAFIAHASEDIPSLLAEVARLTTGGQAMTCYIMGMHWLLAVVVFAAVLAAGPLIYRMGGKTW